MSVAKQLDDFVASIPHSCIVVFADLSTGLVLAAASDQAQTQERIDALAISAKRDWKSHEAQAAHKFFADCGFDRPEYVLSSDAETTTLSVSAPDIGDEGLCISVADAGAAVDLGGEAEHLLTSLLTSSGHQ